MLLQVRRQSGTNTVEVVKEVRAKVDELKAALPPGYSVRLVRDASDFIEASIHNVEEHLIVGSILAAIVVLLFLTNVRSTIIAAIAIPTSIIATFGLLWYMGFTLNLMTMLALTLSVGIVIDDAIVVLENIYRFIEEKHENQLQAAVDATQEIGLAVLATTLSLVAIFVPVGFMGGIVGRFMKSFGLTMAFAIMVSLLVSFTLTPMLSARWLKVKKHGTDEHSSKDSRIFHAVDVVYTRMLEWAMAHRAIVVGDRGAGAALERAALHDRQQELHAAGRCIGVRGQPARAGRHQPRGDRGADQPGRQRDARAAARGGLHARHDRRRPGEDAQPGHDLRAPEADRGAQPRSVRRDGRHPQGDPAAPSPPTSGRRCRRWRSSAAAARRTPRSSS